MTSEEKIDKIIDILDPLCRHRYKEGDRLPRGFECFDVETVNIMQARRECAAVSKARKILAIINE